MAGKTLSDKINSGCYALLLHLRESKDITVGALGQISFKSGYYVYVGRAKRNLSQRISRHINGTGKTRWHIDYLRCHSEIAGIHTTESLDECSLAVEIGAMREAKTIRRFGSGDCRCPSHLFYFKELPDFPRLDAHLKKS